jgi:pentatricopeptide repeat protein
MQQSFEHIMQPHLIARAGCNSLALSLAQAVALLKRLPVTPAVHTDSSAVTSPAVTAAATASETVINPWVSLISLLAAQGLVEEVLYVLDTMAAAGVHRCEQAWSSVVVAAYRSSSRSNSSTTSSSKRSGSSSSSSSSANSGGAAVTDSAVVWLDR